MRCRLWLADLEENVNANSTNRYGNENQVVSVFLRMSEMQARDASAQSLAGAGCRKQEHEALLKIES
jgi:hypothetical protein